MSREQLLQGSSEPLFLRRNLGEEREWDEPRASLPPVGVITLQIRINYKTRIPFLPADFWTQLTQRVHTASINFSSIVPLLANMYLSGAQRPLTLQSSELHIEITNSSTESLAMVSCRASPASTACFSDSSVVPIEVTALHKILCFNACTTFWRMVLHLCRVFFLNSDSSVPSAGYSNNLSGWKLLNDDVSNTTSRSQGQLSTPTPPWLESWFSGQMLCYMKFYG